MRHVDGIAFRPIQVPALHRFGFTLHHDRATVFQNEGSVHVVRIAQQPTHQAEKKNTKDGGKELVSVSVHIGNGPGGAAESISFKFK